MIARVKSSYVDRNGLHQKNEIVDVTKIDPILHEPLFEETGVVEEKKVEEKKPVKASRAKKTKK